jgi:hypothetical protein
MDFLKKWEPKWQKKEPVMLFRKEKKEEKIPPVEPQPSPISSLAKEIQKDMEETKEKTETQNVSGETVTVPPVLQENIPQDTPLPCQKDISDGISVLQNSPLDSSTREDKLPEAKKEFGEQKGCSMSETHSISTGTGYGLSFGVTEMVDKLPKTKQESGEQKGCSTIESYSVSTSTVSGLSFGATEYVVKNSPEEIKEAEEPGKKQALPLSNATPMDREFLEALFKYTHCNVFWGGVR